MEHDIIVSIKHEIYRKLKEKIMGNIMLETILVKFAFLWILVTLGLIFKITLQIDNNNPQTGILIVLKDFIQELFLERNIFGIVLSVIIFIIAIPAMLILLTVQFFFWIICLMSCVWNLGNKKRQ